MNFRNTLAHELGHSLGLPHTFNTQFTPVTGNCRTNCFQECVSRTRIQEGYCFFTAGKKKCEVNGDCFCDTHADIRDNNNYSGEFANCDSLTYNVSAINTLANCLKFDNYGEQWYPSGTWYGVPFADAMSNIMSYWRPCRTKITKMQRGAMYIYSTKKGVVPLNNNSSSFYTNIDVDNYENDNLFHPVLDANNNQMTPNTRQYHTFHLNNGGTTACDIDWVYYQNNSSTAKPFVIQTQEVAGKPKPDTKLALYIINADGTLGTQLASNDDISGTNLFSKITTANLAAYGSFALKIENKVTNVSDTRSKGHYYLRVDACYDKANIAISGDPIICTNKTYSITGGLPTGATVAWTAAPSGYVSISTTNNVATVNKIANGTITLTATISYCGETYTVTKENIVVGIPYVQYSYDGCVYPVAALEPGVEEGPCNSQCYSPSQSKTWCAANVYNATNVTWQKITSIPTTYNFWSGSWSGNNNFVNILFKSPNQYVELKTTMSNTCGSIEQYYCFNSTTTLCPSQMMMMAGGNQTLKVYPNPTSAGNIVSLELYLEEEPIDFENSTIQLLDSKNKIILEKTGKKVTKEQLEIPTISSGTYYISITNVNGTVSEELIINGSR